MSDSQVKLGQVVAVTASRISAMLAGASDIPGGEAVLMRGSDHQVGSLVKVRTGESTAFGLICSLKIENPSYPPRESDTRSFEIELLGESLDPRDGGPPLPFQRGVSVYPALGAEIYPATSEDLSRVYARPRASNLRVGRLHQDRTLPAFVTTDDLLGKHFAVLGTSGSGKSCSVALILRAVLEQNPNGHIVLLDPHNEYAQAFGEHAERIDPETLELPYWLLNFEETVEVLVGRESGSREREVDILKAALVDAKKNYVREGSETAHITVDTPVPYRLASVLRSIDNAMGKLDRPESAAPYLRLKARLETLMSDTRFDFMFSGMFVRDSMAEVLSRVLRVPVDGRPITIVDLSGVPGEIVEVVVSMLCRTIFDFALWSDRKRALPILVVCEEAHRYVPGDAVVGFSSTKKSISRIAKEGRKYGVSLCLVSQRPSELSASVLSQCSTLFALRMSNQNDQEFVARALPDSAHGFLEALPALRTQEAIVVGEGVSVPVRLYFDDLAEEFRPRSATASFSTMWKQEVDPGDLIAETIDRWRRQRR